MPESYPKDFQEFLVRFKTDDDCWNYLFEIRWPNGFECPKCKGSKYWLTADKMIRCSECENQTSITSGTIFHGTRKPLLLWFHVIWWVVAQKTGASANNLADFMGFGSYETAWAWLHKLRRAMVLPGRDKLKGDVEVDEMGLRGDVRVTDDESGRYMCIFQKNVTTDFANSLEAYGFTVWTELKTKGELAYFPINMHETTKLTNDMIRFAWAQINK